MNIKGLAIISSILLLLGIPSGWPYNYYVLLRFTIFLSSIIFAYGFYKSKLTGWALVFGVIAFLFNPIIPIYLNKSHWILIDLTSAILFFLAAYSSKKKD